MGKPEALRDLVFDKLLHREDASESATAADHTVIEGSEGLSFEGLHERVEVDTQKEPGSSAHFQRVSIREIFHLLLALYCGEIDSTSGSFEICEAELDPPVDPRGHLDLQNEVLLVQSESFGVVCWESHFAVQSLKRVNIAFDIFIEDPGGGRVDFGQLSIEWVFVRVDWVENQLPRASHISTMGPFW